MSQLNDLMARLRKSRMTAYDREGGDPDESDRPLPWFMVMLIGAMLMWGAFYVYDTPSGESSSWGDQRTRESLMPVVAAVGSGNKVDGGPIYGAKCVACHQATGVGVPGVFPPLAASEWVVGSPTRLIHILLHGVEGELKVKGVAYKGAMPSFKSLSDAELAAVMTHIRSQWGNQAPAITAEEVLKQREASAARSTPYAGGVELETLP